MDQMTGNSIFCRYTESLMLSTIPAYSPICYLLSCWIYCCIKSSVFIILLSISALTPVPIGAHSHLMPYLPTLTAAPIRASLPLTPARADAQIFTREWQKLSFLIAPNFHGSRLIFFSEQVLVVMQAEAACVISIFTGNAFLPNIQCWLIFQLILLILS